MMFQYQESIAYDDIPVLPMEELARSVIERCRRSWRVVAFFGVPGREGTELVCILADASSRLLDAVRAVMLDAVARKPVGAEILAARHGPVAHKRMSAIGG